MKLLLAALLVLLGASAAPAVEIDMKTVTCARLFGLPEASFASTWFWMDGQIHGTKNTTVYDPAEVPALVSKLKGLCDARPNDIALTVYTEMSQ